MSSSGTTTPPRMTKSSSETKVDKSPGQISKRITSSMMSSVASAASMAAKTATSAGNRASFIASNANSIFKMDVGGGNGGSEIDGESSIFGSILKEIGINDANRSNERNNLCKIFDRSKTVQSDGVDGVSLDKFVMAMRTEKFSVQWADAAFRTVLEHPSSDVKNNRNSSSLSRKGSSKGYLNKEGFLLAATLMKNNTSNMQNATWLHWRRKVIFVYYNRNNNGMLTLDNLEELLTDMTASLEQPEYYGISNRRWCDHYNLCSKAPAPEDHDIDSITKELIFTKLQLAMKKTDYEKILMENNSLKKQLGEG